MQVEVVDQPTIQERFSTTVGPIIEPATIFSIVLVLTLFMLANREDLLGRVIQVIGLSPHQPDDPDARRGRPADQQVPDDLHASTTAICGVILGVGLWLIGVPYAVLWGFLVFVLRFIPYVGPLTAFVLPLGYSIAFSDGWREPAMVVALFVVFEAFSEYVDGADPLRPDDRDHGRRPARLGDVLDLALGAAGALAVDPADGLPGGAGQVRAGPEVLRDDARRGGGARPATPSTTSGCWPATRTAPSRSSRRRWTSCPEARSSTRS